MNNDVLTQDDIENVAARCCPHNFGLEDTGDGDCEACWTEALQCHK